VVIPLLKAVFCSDIQVHLKYNKKKNNNKILILNVINISLLKAVGDQKFRKEGPTPERESLSQNNKNFQPFGVSNLVVCKFRAKGKRGSKSATEMYL
jgi:hypothetical protein